MGTKCEYCGTGVKTESYGPIFVINGFSVNAENGFDYEYIVNQTALAKYLAEGKTLNFGVVVAIGNSSALINPDGSAAEGLKGYASDLTNRGNDIYEIAIKGIPSSYAATMIVCCGYVTDGTNVYYMGATSLGSQAEAHCLNDFTQPVAAAVEPGKENY
jgi:hypothetical protein